MPLFAHRGDGTPLLPEATRQDISDILLSASGLVPPGYNSRPRTRHDRRHNKALLRDWNPVLTPGTRMNEVVLVWTKDGVV